MDFYWITRLDAFHNAAIALCIVGGIFAGAYSIIYAALHYGEEKKLPIYPITITVCVLLLSIATLIFVPTTKEMCAIYAVEYLQNNDDAKQLPDKAVKAANAYFNDLIEKDRRNKKPTNN